MKSEPLLTSLEVLQEDVHGLGLLTEILDDNARATDDLAGIAITVNLAQTSPLSELLGVRDLDEVDVVLGAEGLDELDVLFLSAGLDEDGHVSLASNVILRLMREIGATVSPNGSRGIHRSCVGAHDLSHGKSPRQ